MTASEGIWDRIVHPNEADLPVDVANYFLSLGFTEADKKRYSELANLEYGGLSTAEKSELTTLVAANTFLMLLQAKARLSLKRGNS